MAFDQSIHRSFDHPKTTLLEHYHNIRIETKKGIAFVLLIVTFQDMKRVSIDTIHRVLREWSNQQTTLVNSSLHCPIWIFRYYWQETKIIWTLNTWRLRRVRRASLPRFATSTNAHNAASNRSSRDSRATNASDIAPLVDTAFLDYENDKHCANESYINAFLRWMIFVFRSACRCRRSRISILIVIIIGYDEISFINW